MVKDNIKDGILKTIYKHLRYIGKETNISDIYLSVVYVLYGIHKQYQAVELDNSAIVFINSEDILLNDLYEFTIRENQHLYNLYHDLSFFQHKDFENCYVEILSSLADWESISSRSLDHEEFYSPASITDLMAYYLNNINVKSIFDPFCGTSSIVHRLSKDVLFSGQEQNRRISIIARVNLEAFYGYDNGINCCDSIIEWNNQTFDAVVSCPPFALRFSEYQRQFLNNISDELNGNLEELLFSRAFNKNHAKIVITLEPTGFCFSQENYKLRKYLIDNNYLDSIIFLPEKILYGTSVPCVMIVCKSSRAKDEPIRMIDARSYYLGDNIQERSFDYERFVKTYEHQGESFCTNTSCKDIVSYDYNLNFLLYNQNLVELKEGQSLYYLKDLITELKKVSIAPPDKHQIFMRNHFSSEFSDVLLNKNRLTPSEQVKQIFLRKLVPVVDGNKYLLCLSGSGTKPKYAIYTDKEEFTCINGVKVFSVNDKIVSPEYLVYNLINNPVLKSGYGLLSQYMMLPIIVDSKDDQIELVRKLSQQYAAQIDAEKEADKKRFGVKSNISDLEHLLQTTQANIDRFLYDLKEFYSEDKNYQSILKSLKDNVEYMKRVIRFSNTTINPDMFYLKEQNIEEFIKEYCDAWLNFSGNYFSLSLKTNLGENKKVVFDKTYLKLMLDSILTNVERHGFDKRRNEDNHVEISLSTEKYDNKAYIVIRVANNGIPFKKGFTMDDYITRGRYSANTGRSGLGGYHVYQIAKGHNGFLYLDSNKIWNVIVEVLLPINNVEINNLPVYEHECI